MHNELKRLALSGSDTFPAARLHLGKPVVDVDCENGVLKFEDGSVVCKDVVVGADGVHVCARAIPYKKDTVSANAFSLLSRNVCSAQKSPRAPSENVPFDS